MPSERSNKKILVICPHPVDVAPGQRLKYEQYFDSWKEEGYELSISPFMSMAFWKIVYKKGRFFQKALYTLLGYLRRVYDLFRAPFYDGVYIFLWVSPFGLPIFENLIYRLNKNIIYDIDDMVFLGHVSDANKIILRLKGRSKMIYLMKKAKHVITCTPALDEFVRKYNSNTTDISSTIKTEVYLPKKDYILGDEIVLGWSGSHSTSKYLNLLSEVLLELSKELPIRLKVIGDPDFSMPGVKVKSIAWNRADEVKELSEFDIGLYPLPNESWVYGKSGLKALQYMALGIPTLATNIGANKRIIKDGENGILLDSFEDWKSAIKVLVADEEKRKQIGLAARQTVEDKFSVKANEKVYLNILKNNF